MNTPIYVTKRLILRKFTLDDAEHIYEEIGMEYKYSYREMWEPKNFEVIFRMYQLNLRDGVDTYIKYLDKYDRVDDDV